jgi:hypothetical protein
MSEDVPSHPLNDRIIELPSGKRVRLYTIFSVSGGGPRSYAVQYQSSVPTTDANERRLEAEEVIRYFAYLFEDSVRFMSAQVCSTQAQAAGRDRPEQVFGFERSGNGSWRYTGTLDPSG